MLEVVLLDELLVLDDWLVAIVVAHYILVHDVLMDQAFMGKWLCLMGQSLMDKVSPCWCLDCVVLMDHLLLEWGGLHVDSSHLSLVEVHHLMWADHMLDCLMFLVGRVPLEVVMRPVLIVGDLLVMLPAVDMVVNWLDGDRCANMVVAMLDISLLLMDGMLIPMVVSSILEWMLLISMVVGEAMVVRIVEHLGMIQGVHWQGMEVLMQFSLHVLLWVSMVGSLLLALLESIMLSFLKSMGEALLEARLETLVIAMGIP